MGTQSVVFKRRYGELAEAHDDEATQHQAIEEARAVHAQALANKKSKKQQASLQR